MADNNSAELEHQTSPTTHRILLGSQLRRLREKSGLTRAEAAESIRGSESKISRLELGRVSIKERDVVDLLNAYGISDSAVQVHLREMVAYSNESRWWQNSSYAVSKWIEDYIGLEEAASHIFNYELQFVPGLLQTKEYARAVIEGSDSSADPDEVERRIAVRMRRQQLLTRDNPPHLVAVIDESVLHRPTGGSTIIQQQFNRLLELIELPHISLRIVPFGMSYLVSEGAFVLLRFSQSELPDMVYLEHLRSAIYHEKEEEVKPYRRVADKLEAVATTESLTRKMLLDAQKRFQ